jgi:hypothetical protein
MEHERLVAGAVFAPEHLAAIRQALHPAEIEDEGLRSVYEAVEGLAAEGLVPTPEAVARVVAQDAAAVTALAGLPDDLPFDDWVPDALRHRASRRTAEDRRRTVLQWLVGPASSAQDVPPAPRPLEP